MTLSFFTFRREQICIGINILATILLFGAFYHAGLAEGAIDRLHARYWNYAIPAALSEMSYGLTGYRAYVSVLFHFVENSTQQLDATTANLLIASARALPEVAARGIYLFPGDEKGLQDFVSGAFRLFGADVRSLYLFYLLILGSSLLAHAVCFVHRPGLQALQVVVLAALLATVPALQITSELGSVLNPRAFGLLALPATVSLLCLALSGEVRLWQLPLLAFQTVVIVFVVHVRNAEAWQLAAPLLLAVILAFIAWRRSGFGFRGIYRLGPIRSCVTVIVLVCGIAFPAHAAIQARFAPEYFATKLVHKIFWHNVGIGFSVSPYFRKRYGLALTDTNFLLHVANSPEVAAAGEAGRRVFWTGTYTGQWVGGDPEIPEASAMYHSGMVRDFSGYESFARQVVFRLALRHPWRTARLLLYDKPKLLLAQLANASIAGVFAPADLMLEDQAAALMNDTLRIEKGANLRLMSLFSVLAIVVFAASLVVSRETARLSIAASAALLVLLSTAPMIATYPLIHLMASTLVAVVFGLMIAFGLLAAALTENRAARRGSPATEAPSGPNGAGKLRTRGLTRNGSYRSAPRWKRA